MGSPSLTLTVRELNRAHLARQMLLERAPVGVVEAIERLACLQAQWAPSPYVALWARLEGFERSPLTEAIDAGAVIKTTLMRGTLHLISALEYPEYATALAPRLARASRAGVIWEPQSAHWEHRTRPRVVAPSGPLLRAVSADDAADLLVTRYLSAFGPATVADIAYWSGTPVGPLRAALARREVVRFADEAGRQLFDLPEAPRPLPDTAAPPRFLARYDAALLGHAPRERVRILPEEYRSRVIRRGEVFATFLVDGMVAGVWRVQARPKQAVLTIEPFVALPASARASLEEEGESLVRFVAPDSATHTVDI